MTQMCDLITVVCCGKQGKTLQTISLLCHLKEKGATGPSLVVCPLSVLNSWTSELKKWAPSLRFLRVHSSDAKEQESQRKELTDNVASYDVVITTYEMVKVPPLMSAWSRIYFNCFVLDEGHKIKSHETQIAQCVRKVHSECKIILTGTPLQNNLVELWSLLNFFYPEVFVTHKPFEAAFNITENRVDKVKLQE